MSDWLNPQEIPVPQHSNFPTLADFIVGYRVYGDLVNASLKFLAANPDPQYASPQAYLGAVIQDSIGIPKFSSAFAPQGWNAVQSGINAVLGPKGAFDILQQLPVNAGDPNTLSVYDAWVAKTGQLYGGHPATPTGANQHVSAGQEAAPPGSIL